MTHIKDGGPAFPGSYIPSASPPSDGVTLRDWYAGQAMSQGMAVLVSSQHNLNKYQLRQLAKTAFLAADAMIAEREERQP